MKLNRAHMHVAIVECLLDVSSVKELAKQVSKRLNNIDKDCVEIQDTKTHGFILRRKKDAEVSDSMVSDAIISAVKDILDDNSDEVLEYIADNYEYVYDSDYVDEKFVDNIFDITRSGRLIYVEIDA